MKQFARVLTFTFLERVRSRVFRVGTVLLLLLAAAAAAAPAIVNGFAPTSMGNVAVVNETQLPVRALNLHRLDPVYNWIPAAPSTELALARRVRDRSGYAPTALVTLTERSGRPPHVDYLSRSPHPTMVQTFTNYIRALYLQKEVRQLGLSPSQAAALTAGVTLSIHAVGSVSNSSQFAILGMVVLLFMAITLYGNLIAMSIAAEKGSRVQELLIASVKSTTLLYGKLVGVALVGLVQFALLVGVFAATAYGVANGQLPYFNFAGTGSLLLVEFALNFLLGFFFFASLYAAVGSLVSRPEDVQTAAVPVQMLIIVPYLGATFAVIHPHAVWVTVCSFIPFFSPTFILIRLGAADAPLWQAAVAEGILLVSTILALRLSAKIYRTGVMIYGARPTWRQLRVLLRGH